MTLWKRGKRVVVVQLGRWRAFYEVDWYAQPAGSRNGLTNATERKRTSSGTESASPRQT